MMVKSVTARSKCDKIIIGRFGLYVVLGFPLMLGSAENLKGAPTKSKDAKGLLPTSSLSTMQKRNTGTAVASTPSVDHKLKYH
jgi:hypothetical protein